MVIDPRPRAKEGKRTKEQREELRDAQNKQCRRCGPHEQRSCLLQTAALLTARAERPNKLSRGVNRG